MKQTEPYAGDQTKRTRNHFIHLYKAPALTHVQNVQGGDLRGGRAQLIGCFYPDLIGSKEGRIAGDVARITLLACSIISTLLFSLIPPEQNKIKTK